MSNLQLFIKLCGEVRGSLEDYSKTAFILKKQLDSPSDDGWVLLGEQKKALESVLDIKFKRLSFYFEQCKEEAGEGELL